MIVVSRLFRCEINRLRAHVNGTVYRLPAASAMDTERRRTSSQAGLTYALCDLLQITARGVHAAPRGVPFPSVIRATGFLPAAPLLHLRRSRVSTFASRLDLSRLLFSSYRDTHLAVPAFVPTLVRSLARSSVPTRARAIRWRSVIYTCALFTFVLGLSCVPTVRLT